PQVADIGLMGTKVRKDGKTVEGVDIFMGGKVGKDARLGDKVQQGVACDDLQAVLTNLLIEHFQAQPRSAGDPNPGRVEVMLGE
ncbi:MAG: ferredoxin--nitrite reductase, partial [Leptolyngbyaceae cyanobacterium SM2_5_2]|nr:ferredoxin--nitrite reductase [Leptolyngbyaceae cyanobacterium SM2_5_2]